MGFRKGSSWCYLIASLKALRALARTVLEAGFAENIIFSPVKGLVPSRALVAGLLRIFNLRRPGRVKTPGPFLPSCSTMIVWRESRTETTCFLESSVCSAMVLRTWLLVMAFFLSDILKNSLKT